MVIFEGIHQTSLAIGLSLSNLFCLSVSFLQYLRLSLTCMCEAWEDILMQMDLRLTKFVQVSGHCLGPGFQKASLGLVHR